MSCFCVFGGDMRLSGSGVRVWKVAGPGYCLCTQHMTLGPFSMNFNSKNSWDARKMAKPDLVRTGSFSGVTVTEQGLE